MQRPEVPLVGLSARAPGAHLSALSFPVGGSGDVVTVSGVPAVPEQPFNPPQGECHTLGCDEPTTMLVQVWRKFAGCWTQGIDFCEPHAHAFAARVSLASKVTPL